MSNRYMQVSASTPPLPWLEPGEPFPEPSQAWGPGTAAPGLLAAGPQLDANALEQAYRQGIFPWYSAGQPVLWWSPDPRMVLPVAQFKVSKSLAKTLRRFVRSPACAGSGAASCAGWR